MAAMSAFRDPKKQIPDGALERLKLAAYPAGKRPALRPASARLL